MLNGIWDTPSEKVFSAMKRYSKALKGYLSAKGGVEVSKTAFNTEYHKLISALSDPQAQTRIDQVLSVETENQPPTQLISQEELDRELEFAPVFGLTLKRLQCLLKGIKPSKKISLEVSDSTELIKMIKKYHLLVITETEKSRKIANRLEKKKRKRDLLRGVSSIIFGTGCAIVNSYALKYTVIPEAKISYGAFLIAVHQGMRDIIGEPVDNQD